MSTPDTDLLPPVPPVEETEEKRGRGRPSTAELDARRAALDAREEEIRIQEAEVELAAAEANLAMREARIEASQVAAGRSNGVRAGTIRSEDVTVPVRQRKYKGGLGNKNKFDIAMEDIPNDMSYQWNNSTVYGKEDHSYNSDMAAQGWEPVHSSRHPHLVPPGYDGPIILDGMVLVERPKELTQEAIREDRMRALGEVRAKEDQLYGARPDTPVGRSLGIKKDFERPTAELPRGASYSYETPGQGGVVIE